MEYKLEPAPCFYSTTEGEPELYPKGITQVAQQSAPMHWDRTTILDPQQPVCTFTLVMWWETLQWKQGLMVWTSTQPTAKESIEQVSCHHCKGKTMPHHHYAYICACLVSVHTILFSQKCSTHVSSPQNKIMFTTQNIIRKDQRPVPGLLYNIQNIHHGYPPQRCKSPPGQKFGYPHRRPWACQYQQWWHSQLQHHSCPRRSRSSRTSWRPSTQ